MKKNIKILFVNVEEVAHITDIGLPPYREWIEDVTGLSKEQIITVNVADGEVLPETFEGIDGIIGGGSGHQPYDNDLWIKQTGAFLKKAHEAGVPQLLSCFCHQIFADAFGGQTALGEHERRFGIEIIHLTDAGQRDPLYTGLPQTFELFTSHSAVIKKLPPSANINVVELAKTDHYPYESLSYGGKTRTIQAHPDLKERVLEALATRRTHPLAPGIPSEVYKRYLASPPDPIKVATIEANGKKIFKNWLTYFVMPNID